MFEGQIYSPKRVDLLYDDVSRHYYVITNMTGAMAKYVCKACNKGCDHDVTHICDQTCSDCMASTPCTFSDVRIPCAECTRHIRSRAFFDKHKYSTAKRKSVCERKRCCTTCGVLTTSDKHEYNKRFCDICKQNREVG